MKLEQNKNCLVCGFAHPEGLYLIEQSQEFCRCCGAIIGYTYDVDEGHGAKEYRNTWASEGYIFVDEDLEPKNWNKEMALAQIKANVPEEFQ